MASNKKHILITGGLGFIGTNLMMRLLAEDDRNYLIVVDNLQCGQSLGLIKAQGILDHPRVRIYYENICDPSLYATLLHDYSPYDHPISEIYHLASIASPIWYKKYPIETLDVSYTGTKNVLEFARNYPGVRVLLASSSEVYGDAEVSPQPESYFGNTNSYGDRSCYDEGKRVMEAMAHSYQRVYGGGEGVDGQLKIRIARIFNTYGPYMNIEDGRVIPSFIKSIISGEPIKMFNGGMQTRCFNYIDDTLNGLTALMTTPCYSVLDPKIEQTELKSDLDQPINIGNDREITMWELLEIMKGVIREKFPEFAGRIEQLEIVHGTSDRDDPKVRRPDLGRAREYLGYFINTRLENGLEETIRYFIMASKKE